MLAGDMIEAPLFKNYEVDLALLQLWIRDRYDALECTALAAALWRKARKPLTVCGGS
jgi:hypothetical protein